MAVEDTRIWTGCEFIYSLYDNGKDSSYYMSRDHINALAISHVTRDNDFDAVLGCQDACIRIIQVGRMLLYARSFFNFEFNLMSFQFIHISYTTGVDCGCGDTNDGCS